MDISYQDFIKKNLKVYIKAGMTPSQALKHVARDWQHWKRGTGRNPKRPSFSPHERRMEVAEERSVISSWVNRIRSARDPAAQMNVLRDLIRQAKQRRVSIDIAKRVIKATGTQTELEMMIQRKTLNPGYNYYYCTKCKKYHNYFSKIGIEHRKYRRILPGYANPGSELYEAFHGAPPAKQREVLYQPPKGPLIKIGRLSQINYIPEAPSKRRGTEYYHKSGDLGHKTITSNAILATDLKGKNLYIVRDKGSKYPIFTERGIIG